MKFIIIWSTPPVKIVSRFLSAAAAIVALNAASAAAAPIVIQDQMDSASTYHGADYSAYSSANFADRAAGGKHWGDELYDPGHRFDTTSMTINRNAAAGSITFTLHTMFNGNDEGAKYADLFLDITTPNTPDSYGYAIALGSQTKAVGFYSVSSASTSNDVWGGQGSYVYGGFSQFKTTSADYDPALALAVPVRLDAGTVVGGTSVAVTRSDVGGGFFDVDVVLQGVDLGLFDSFDLLWGTGDCGNDTIWGTTLAGGTTTAPVDAPPALWLMGFGLFAMAGFARRRQRAFAP